MAAMGYITKTYGIWGVLGFKPRILFAKLGHKVNEALTLARFKALSDPARLRLVRILAELPDDHTVFDPRCGTAFGVCFCHLEERLGLSKPTVSHHLKILREAGLIEVIRVGKWSYYRLRPESLEGLIVDVTKLRPTKKLIQLELPAS